MSRTFQVPDISCGHCKAAIEEQVGALDTVDTVTVDVDTRTVAVDGSASDEQVRGAIAEAGYEVAPS